MNKLLNFGLIAIGLLIAILLIMFSFNNYMERERIEERMETLQELDESSIKQQAEDLSNAKNIEASIYDLDACNTDRLFNELPTIKTDSNSPVSSRVETYTYDNEGQDTNTETRESTAQERINQQSESMESLSKDMCPPVWNDTLEEYIPVPCEQVED